MLASTLTDVEVIARVRSGEIELYGILAQRHHKRICKILTRILPGSNDLEDVLQQVHLQALNHLGGFEGRSSFLTWLTRIVINEAYTHLRRRRDFLSVDAHGRSSERPSEEFSSPDAGPERRVIQKQLREMLESAIASLPHQYRVVIRVRTIEERSTADASAFLGISEQGVKSRLFRAKRLLRRKMWANLQTAS
jgi:RNA polymerase sigma-70 factor (ECF subfamily)